MTFNFEIVEGDSACLNTQSVQLECKLRSCSAFVMIKSVAIQDLGISKTCNVLVLGNITFHNEIAF